MAGESRVRPHLTLLGVPVRVEWTFWLVAIFLGVGVYSGGLLVAWVAVVFVSILVHEFGHALVLRAFEHRPHVVLQFMGGVTYGSHAHRSRAESIIVSVAGPLTALVVLGLPAYALMDNASGDAYEVLRAVAFVNIFWSIANLAPILPLDGGNVTAALIGIRNAHIVSIVVAGAGAVWLFANNFEFGALFAVMFAATNFAALQGPRTSQSPAPSSRARTLDLQLAREQLAPDQLDAVAWQALANGDTATARGAIAHSVNPAGASRFLTGSIALAEGRTTDGVTDLTAAYLQQPGGPASLVPAIVIARAGAADELARRLLQGPMGAQAAHGLQTHLHYADCFADSARVGSLVYADGRQPRARVAFEVACAVARAGDASTALAWVQRSLDDGLAVRGAGTILDTEPDLAAVRALPEWPSTRARAR